jgi:predicted nucleic acid-binding protein
VYLIDTNVISEARKKDKADGGVLSFFREVAARDDAVYLSAVTIGELRRGVELIRHRGDTLQAQLLERWLQKILTDYQHNILEFDTEAAQVWGKLRVPHHEHELDKQIAATALVHDLTVVTRNTPHFEATGARLLNPFKAA